MTPKCPDCKYDQDDCSCSETIESLRQQLAATLAAIKAKDEALNAIATTGVIREAKWCGMSAKDIAELALVTTADLKEKGK